MRTPQQIKNCKKWVAALRSGEYKQGQNSLREQDTYCCLGVACELAVKDGIDINVRVEQNRTYYAFNRDYLPKSVQDWLGLTNKTGKFYTSYNCISSLASKNDNGNTFEEIADIIESEPLGLFV